MRILLFGATGMIGSRIAAEAGKRGHEVTSATRSGKDGTLAADASDADTVARLAAGHDAVVLAVSPPRDGIEATESLLEVGRGVLDGVRRAGVRRLVVVGGAGILEVSPGVRVVDTPGFPEDFLPPVRAQVALFELVRDNADDLEWTYLSPPAMVEPGERTGAYRIGDHQLLSDGEGNSHISTEDYAVALVDELQRGELTRRLVHVAY
ncbi:NAD(P)H-binding protein [Streptomyces sp. PSKA54]|uniref:NAD(P)H-binding protein n=1 Tax=Streptomyces himalayensis subsp. aureolus TaxID=2758039 RepID=A0A7W2D777_9ACTN|nr:NAD(P)H-binding protein [Streptomyces himalayensis]MBA4866022.1 NAD(P)H-binding protein [Streptomyces himalayensis subsp. aureolus]